MIAGSRYNYGAMAIDLRRFRFVQLDVFTSKPFEGNSLAVFSDATGLSDEEMQTLAREMNLSETTFILPRDAVERERGIRVRIFTVQEELPFAGHPDARHRISIARHERRRGDRSGPQGRKNPGAV